MEFVSFRWADSIRNRCCRFNNLSYRTDGCSADRTHLCERFGLDMILAVYAATDNALPPCLVSNLSSGVFVMKKFLALAVCLFALSATVAGCTSASPAPTPAPAATPR